MTLDATHDPALRSWVESANDPATDFPIQNLPFGRFRRDGGEWRLGVAIGSQLLDLQPVIPGLTRDPSTSAALSSPTMNALMSLPVSSRRALRVALSNALREGSPSQSGLSPHVFAQAEVELAVPCTIGDYTDFYTGIHHATAVGKLFRPDNPLLPNYDWVPIGYHGRSSSIVPSGRAVRRPAGQLKSPDAAQPRFGPCERLDYEVELGFLIGAGNAWGEPVPIEQGEEHLFGVTLFNDWSARDIQAWEYQPLGPFLSKNFGSTISPWVVTLEALAPFRAPLKRPPGHPDPLPYLDSKATREQGGFDIRLETWLQTEAMRKAGQPAVRIATSNAADAAFWTAAQLVAHHTSGGCNLQPGDLFGSGTLSGTAREQAGSLLELTLGGKEKLKLPNGEERTFLLDGDTLKLRGVCEREGARRIGFGECAGTIAG